VIVACVAVVIATIARLSVAAMGVDSFTAFIVFIVVIAIQVVVYLSIHVFLQGMMLPWIGRGLAKIPYFKKRMEERDTSIVEEEIASTSEPVSLKDIRVGQLQNKAKEQEEKLNVVLDYTRNCFALYVSDEHLETLIRNVQVYINRLDTKELKPIKVKELTINDLRHFGWNIWNFSKPRNQMDIAYFLKIVFPDAFKDTEVESIKRHLKDDELKGIIKIKEKLV
jgi:hypothetical protein